MIVPSRPYKTSDKVDYAKVFSNDREHKKWLFEQDVEKDMKWHEERLQEKWDKEYYECLNKVRARKRYSIWKENHIEEASKEERSRHFSLWFESSLPCVLFVFILCVIAWIINYCILDGFHSAGFPDMTIQDPLFSDVFGHSGFLLELIFPPIVSRLMFLIMRWKLYRITESDGSRYPNLVVPTTAMCFILWGIEVTSNFLLPTIFFFSIILLCAGIPLWFFVVVVDGLSNPEDDLPYKRIDFLDE